MSDAVARLNAALEGRYDFYIADKTARSPHGAHVLVVTNRTVLGHQDGPAVPSGRNDHLVGGITMKVARQPAALDQNGTRQFGHVSNPSRNRRQVEPLVERPVRDELPFLDLLGDLPDRDERQPQRVLTEGRRDGLTGTLWTAVDPRSPTRAKRACQEASASHRSPGPYGSPTSLTTLPAKLRPVTGST